MTITLDGTSGITAPTYAGNIASEYQVPVTAFKNRIINGAMVIDQRNAGASITPTTDNTYTLDRYITALSQSSKFSVQQNAGSVTPPAGFNNYLGVTSLSAYSVLAGDYFAIQQRIEGFNTLDFGWGAAGASTVTLSFWVRSSLTGTFGGCLANNGFSRSYPFSYTISSANTWEQKTITVAGDTSGTWLKTNGIGIRVSFALGYGATYGNGTAGAWVGSDLESVTGATSVVGTNGATFYITGVQLEKGSTATSFDYRPVGTELALCQRYLPAIISGGTFDVIGVGGAFSTTQTQVSCKFNVPARVAVTGITVSAAADPVKDLAVLKTQWKNTIRQQAYSLLQSTDYMEIRNMRDATYKPEWMVWRESVRDVASMTLAAIDLAPSISALQVTVKVTWPNNPDYVDMQ